MGALVEEVMDHLAEGVRQAVEAEKTGYVNSATEFLWGWVRGMLEASGRKVADDDDTSRS
jgi:hypothetical protein